MRINNDNKHITGLVKTRLKQSEWWTDKTRENGTTIQGLTCPTCGKKGVGWCYIESPMSINCNRLDECDAHTNILELLNICQDLEREFKPTKTEPMRPARIFLESRGLSQALNGLKYSYWPDVRKTGSGAVMFPVYKDQKGKAVFNGRLINPTSKSGKAHNLGSTSGKFWQHPGIEYDQYKPTWITENIIDALTLIELDLQAIAVLTSDQDPKKVDLSHLNKLVLAFDNDHAGTRATKKWKKHYPEAETVMPDKRQGWNDILCSGQLEQVKKRFPDSLPRLHANADLALAESARDYATIYRKFFNKVPGLFVFDGCTYFSTLKKRGDDKYLAMERVGNFSLKVLSYFIDTSNPEHPEYRYHLIITPKKGRPISAVATGRDLATPRGMKEFLLSHAKVSFEAGGAATIAICTMITTTNNVPEVNQLALTGYDLKTRWYVYKHFAIDPIGKLHRPDKQDLFNINFCDKITPPSHAGDKVLKPANSGLAVRDIHELVTTGWGNNGAAALAWMVGGWFVNQIKAKIGYFPFLSLYGEPASGKSALTVFLNSMQCIDGEGLPLSQLNTPKALARTISRVSGNFTALLEDNQRNERAFDYSIILTGYNRGPLQLKAAFSNDNRTKESPFQGSLMFVQNIEPFNKKAEKQRVISLEFEPTSLTNSTRAAYERLNSIPLPELARVLVLTLRQRQLFEKEWQDDYKSAIEDIEGVDISRIQENHALILAFHRIFCRVHNIEYDLTEFMIETAKLKCKTSALKEFSIANHFFETIDELEEDKTVACLHKDPEKRLIHINLPGIEKLIRMNNYQLSPNNLLGQSLTQHPAFIASSKRFRFPADPEVDSKGRPKQRRCFVFDANKFG